MLAVVVAILFAADPTVLGARIALGERVFHDTRFSNTVGDLATSCGSCHGQSGPAGFPAHLGPLRDADPELGGIHLVEDDIRDLFAILNTLNDSGARGAVFTYRAAACGTDNGQ